MVLDRLTKRLMGRLIRLSPAVHSGHESTTKPITGSAFWLQLPFKAQPSSDGTVATHLLWCRQRVCFYS